MSKEHILHDAHGHELLGHKVDWFGVSCWRWFKCSCGWESEQYDRNQ